ncbi:MAG: capsular biosynthesis protein [Clostridia bacterium]|nr:capsular biosynthesis protein [Clostridia bacterium]
MVDIHSHIIPKVDDGAKEEKETLLILKQAQKAGFTDIICTPHYRQEYKKSQDEIKKVLENIKADIENYNIRIHLGREVYISEDILELLKDNKIGTLANSRYMLIELPFENKIVNISQISYILKENGIIPILAHPERYDFVKKSPEVSVRKFIRNGWLIQCNYGSIIGQYGWKSKFVIKKLLKKGYVHFLASDIHQPKTVYNKMPQIIEKLKKLVSKIKFDEITTINGLKILKNEEIKF